ncbi:MAG: hypothetical protein Q4D21_05495, partial [Phascolarctobacterium sp.]|nr:hypothetical protein [Phascolarctobacterium sp.]
GEAIGIAKGEAIGIEKNKLSTAKNLIRLGKLSLEDIASASGLSLEVVQKLSEEVLAEET